MSNRIIWGCIADDYTGASDAASFLAKGGLRTLLLNELPPHTPDLSACDALVIGLKTRAMPPEEAVRQSLAALDFLKSCGAEKIYVKYCSTFDCTPKGNIGPVMDAMMEKLGARYTLLCPSLPVNGRTVQDGKLSVYGVPLHESPMKNHPLNPMWTDSLSDLMRPQSKLSCVAVANDMDDVSAEQRLTDVLAAHPESFYLVPDYATQEDGLRIARRFGSLPLLSGGSGLLEQLALCEQVGAEPIRFPGSATQGLLLCGSCSAASARQIRAYEAAGGASIAIDPASIVNGSCTAAGVFSRLQNNTLVYSVGAFRSAVENRPEHAQVLEQFMSELTRLAAENGFRRLIVGGGETSGAVVQALGFESFLVGQSVAPGVPVLMPSGAPEYRLVLKSGNFGQEDFFLRAVSETSKGAAI